MINRISPIIKRGKAINHNELIERIEKKRRQLLGLPPLEEEIKKNRNY